jgi:hypothetical protein
MADRRSKESASPSLHISKTSLPQLHTAAHARYWVGMWEVAGSREGVAVTDPRQVGTLLLAPCVGVVVAASGPLVVDPSSQPSPLLHWRGGDGRGRGGTGGGRKEPKLLHVLTLQQAEQCTVKQRSIYQSKAILYFPHPN